MYKDNDTELYFAIVTSETDSFLCISCGIHKNYTKLFRYTYLVLFTCASSRATDDKWPGLNIELGSLCCYTGYLIWSCEDAFNRKRRCYVAFLVEYFHVFFCVECTSSFIHVSLLSVLLL